MTEIERLRKDIEGPGEDARFLAFLNLYESRTPEAEAEIERIMTFKDPVLKLMLLRFLGHIGDRRAVALICRLMEDENDVVSGAAERAFDRNPCDGKLKHLEPLIVSSKRRTRLAAMERVAQAGWLEAVPALVRILDLADEEVRLAALSALRFLPSRLALPIIQQQIRSPDGEVRFRAVLAAGAIYEAFDEGLHPVLVSCTRDESARVRQAALWALRRKPRRRNLPVLLHLSAKDPDPLVRQEALLGLKSYPNIHVIRHLLKLLTFETNRMVMLRCESVLLSMDHAELLKALQAVIRKSAGLLHSKAILLAAEFQRGSGRYYDFLVRTLHAAATDREKVAVIEALGALGDPRAAGVLVPFLEQSPLVAYVAMSALLQASDETWQFLAYLESSDGSLLLKQMILRHLIRRNHLVAIHQNRLERCLLGFLRGDNINMRYLAAQVLVQVSSRVAQEALLEAAQTETDPTSLKLLNGSLVDFFTRDPPSFVTFLHGKRLDAGIFQALCALLGQLIWNGVDIISQLPRLFSSELVETGDAYVSCCSEWLAQQIVAGRVMMDDVIRTLEHTVVMDAVLQQVAARISEVPNLRFRVSPSLLWRRLAKGNDVERGAVIELMGASRNPTSIPVLVSVVCNSGMKPFHDRATRALARITREAM